VPNFNVSVRTSGPVFDGRAVRAVRDFQQAAEKAVAQEGAKRVRVRLKKVLRHPTGYYMGHIAAEKVANLWEVNDDGVVYGPWLEGTGSRNRTTRFKGYATFRMVKSLLDAQSAQIAQRELPRYLARMNG